jgi:hypothetical protein
MTRIADREVVIVFGVSSSAPDSAASMYNAIAAPTERAFVPPEGSRFWCFATLSRASASSASSRVPITVRETRRRLPVTASRGSSMSIFHRSSAS